MVAPTSARPVSPSGRANNSLALLRHRPNLLGGFYLPAIGLAALTLARGTLRRADYATFRLVIAWSKLGAIPIGFMKLGTWAHRGMSTHVDRESIRRAFSVRAARNHADVHRRNDPHGRGRHVVRHHAQEERQVLF